MEGYCVTLNFYIIEIGLLLSMIIFVFVQQLLLVGSLNLSLK